MFNILNLNEIALCKHGVLSTNYLLYGDHHQVMWNMYPITDVDTGIFCL